MEYLCLILPEDGAVLITLEMCQQVPGSNDLASSKDNVNTWSFKEQVLLFICEEPPQCKGRELSLSLGKPSAA